MAKKPRPLDERDLMLLEAFVRNPEASQQAIANALGVGWSLRSVNRRYNNPAFQEELELAYTKRIDKAVKIAQAYQLDAVRELVRIITGKNPDGTVRFVEDRDRINAVLALDKMRKDGTVKVEFPKGIPLAIDLAKLTPELIDALAQIYALCGIEVPA